MKLELTDGKLEGIKHIRPAAYKDERGYFLETYSQVDFKNSGLNANFLQDNESKSTKGVLRGM
ncbi:MAG TPA: dTDP-4-dehydrorhamnose 3,5-epimerase family protein, partial [Clostridia bacterium]|nr:dTDP-4-dehydrorhamnose 3,5-epimerase family protein [Clostridia bacterium]